MKKVLLLMFSLLFAAGALFGGSMLKDFNINEYKNMYQITLTFDTVPAYKEMTLDSPMRIVLDLQDTVMVPSKRTVSIQRPPFREIRVAQFTPTSVRFVLELSEKLIYTVSKNQNTLIVSLPYRNEDKVDTVQRFVDVKVAPRPDSVTLTQVKIGTPVKVLNEKEDWLLILLPDGQDGWVKKESIQL
jgi:hypothetical protein